MSETKSEVAAQLRAVGLRLIDIASELYPQEYQEYLRTRSRRLYLKLARRVKALLKYYESRTRNNEVLEHSSLITLDYAGGERDPLLQRQVFSENNVIQKKMGKNGLERQFYEYEQFIYRLYVKSLEPHDVDGSIWATALRVHRRVFYEYYNVYKENVWVWANGRSSASYIAYAYAYSVLVSALILHGRGDYRYHILRSIPVPLEKLRYWLRRVGPRIFSYIF